MGILVSLSPSRHHVVPNNVIFTWRHLAKLVMTQIGSGVGTGRGEYVVL